MWYSWDKCSETQKGIKFYVSETHLAKVQTLHYIRQGVPEYCRRRNNKHYVQKYTMEKTHAHTHTQTADWGGVRF